MSLVSKLMGFGLRQVLDTAAADLIGEVARYFRDHSQTLPKALTRAHDRAWQSLAIALAGDGFLDQLRVFFASGDDKGIREQVRHFLQSSFIPFKGTPAEFRRVCLAELNHLRKSGLLACQGISAEEIARQTASFRCCADMPELIAGAHQAVSELANELPKDYANLAKLLRITTPGRPPLLVGAFAYFFRREVETDPELARGLLFDGLRQLAASQARELAEVQKALTTLGQQSDAVFEQLGRIEVVAVQAHAVAAETHGAVLDLQAELQRLGDLHLANTGEVRSLLLEVQGRLGQAGMQRGEVKPQHSFSIRGEDERRAIKALLDRFRQLPAEQQVLVPALLNGLGKLQIGTGDFGGARQTFAVVAESVQGPSDKAEAHYNAYRAALEQKQWDEALAAIQQAETCDPRRFAPFPLHRYEPQRILGAGAFGTAFHCHDRNFGEDVVVKALHTGDLARTLADVFTEAKALRRLSHPAIIGVRDCEYADPLSQARPYIVMDYFPGVSLEKFVVDRGTLSPGQLVTVARQVASAMQAAHQRGILHRDLKPENVLVRKRGELWQVRIIDFGLALRRETIQASTSAGACAQTVLNQSVAGTVKYAPPEQLGELPGVKPGPYSDVYSFGKLCCYAVFKTTEPRSRHLNTLPVWLREMLERCLERELEHRYGDFARVLQVLETPDAEGKAKPAQPEALPARADLAAPQQVASHRIYFSCPSCTASLRVKPSSAGGKVRCPRCRSVICAPKESGKEVSSPTNSEEAEDHRRRATQDEHLRRAWSHLKRGEYEQALATVKWINAHDPVGGRIWDPPMSINIMAILSLLERDYDRAITMATTAMQCDPQYYWPHFIRGATSRMKGDSASAITDLTQALRLNPGDTLAEAELAKAVEDDYLRRAWSHLQRGEYKQACAVAKEMLSLDLDTHPASNNSALAISCLAVGDCDRAIAEATTAIRFDAAHYWAHFIRGTTSRLKRDFALAITDLTQALRLNPGDTLAEAELAKAQRRQ
jgi:predicted Zn finger-like uncharacterized protein